MYNWIGIVLILVLCIAWQADAAVNCETTGPGRFADPEDKTCQKYTFCVYDSITSSYRNYSYVCPTTSVFNPNTAKCTASNNYVCKIKSSNSTSNSSDCTAEGYFIDPRSTNCSSYIECVQINGTYIQTTYTCPADTYFDPNTALCERNYNCTFRCTAPGRFPDTSDTTCKTYYFCVSYGNTTYVQYNYTCPSTSVFNPRTKICTTTYRCS